MAQQSDRLTSAEMMLCTSQKAGKSRLCVAGAAYQPAAVDSARNDNTKKLCRVSLAEVRRCPIRVLVVDDDSQTRELCRRLLEREGYVICEASDGLDALEKVHSCSPDVIVLDAMMPRLDGLECARRLKTDTAAQDIPIIMLSAASESADIEAGLKAGADEYITKPLRHREFTLRVRSMARLHRSMAELLWSNATRWEQTRVLQVLFDLSAGLVGEERLDRVLERIVSAASELTRSRRIAIMLPDSEGTCLMIAHSIGVDETLAANVLVPIGKGITGKVFLTGEHVVVNSPEETGAHPGHCDSPFFASVPLISKALRATNRVLGVLNITERQGQQPFEAGELETLDLLCNVAATAIDDILSRQAHDLAQDSMVLGLATLAEHRDTETGTHLDRVTHYALLLAKELQGKEPFQAMINDEFLRALRRAMPLHDIGKVGVPDSILQKPGRLTDTEMRQMRRHAEIGARTIHSVRELTPGVDFLRIAEEIAWSHHERWDGTGYPQGMAGRSIPLSARIAALADVYDALTTNRVYKDAIPHDQAVRIIREGAGTQFDPDIVEAFLARESEFASTAAELAGSSNLAALVEAVSA
jgi:response regulator RpfG family c-di-GMP phosphodiesterase